ncbi:MAG: response regulator [Planctomycetes bacterium]|nr:response regulator [Planctomycetota bacterium]
MAIETTVIVVEDDDVIRRLIRHQLTEAGYRAVSATDADEAIAVIAHESPAMAVVSLGLPRGEGVELCRRIRQRGHDQWIYTLVIADPDDTARRIDAFEAGADDSMARPFQKDELIWRLRTGERVAGLERDVAARDDRIRLLEHGHAGDDTILTGRTAAERGLIEEWSSAVSRGGALASIMIDVDPEPTGSGEPVIDAVASTLRRTFGSADQIYRTAERKFLVLLPGSTAAMAAVAGERARVAVATMARPGLERADSATISLGIAERCGGMSNVADLLSSALDALDDARAAGRNCIRIAPTAPHAHPASEEDVEHRRRASA